MSSIAAIPKVLLEDALNWFDASIRSAVINPIESHFPRIPLPTQVQVVRSSRDELLQDVQGWPGDLTLEEVGVRLRQHAVPRQQLFKEIVLRSRRVKAAVAEQLTEKTFDLQLVASLQFDTNALDALVNQDWFQQIAPLRLPRLSDYLKQFAKDNGRNCIATYGGRRFVANELAIVGSRIA